MQSRTVRGMGCDFRLLLLGETSFSGDALSKAPQQGRHAEAFPSCLNENWKGYPNECCHDLKDSVIWRFKGSEWKGSREGGRNW